ncbi:MAG TPA: flavodoxin domain-containing protein [Prolixibacteraceae bacterium]|nr:flavodoxin domain-containing protein [Prolixibacteraceae bacterium]HPS12446.1 flavodoxin domain-containing protein [Prolixibacteraceae bacterium]
MRTAIVYASKHGTTAKVAENIQKMLPLGEAVLLNLADNKTIEFHLFDRILIGSSVYAGSIQPKARKFVAQNMVDLLQKEVGIFVCCMFFEKANEQIEKGFPEVLRKHARSIKHMGGEFLFDEMNMIERFLVEKITGKKSTVHNIDDEKIREFIVEIGS